MSGSIVRLPRRRIWTGGEGYFLFLQRVLIDRAAFFCYTWGQGKAGRAFEKSQVVKEDFQ